MQPDTFGNLGRRSEILAKLKEISRRGCLDEHQVGLARILRFKQDRKLLRAALEYAAKIEKSSDILIAEVLNVLVDQNLPVAIRASAAGVMGHLICRRPAEAASDFDLDTVIESMIHVLSKSETPVLKRALCDSIGMARDKRSQNGGGPILQTLRPEI